VPVEIEKKYRLTKSQRRQIEQRMRELSITPGELEHEENTIYRGGVLERPGCALRLRRVNGRAILTFKQRRPSSSAIKFQDENEVAVGEMGTLKIKGDSAALCYWSAHEKSKATFAGDWCTTGDQFHVDAEGYYWYHGRTDDMLKVSGIFVAPAEIENCLLQHEAVAECAVVGHEDNDGLVKPKAFIVPREGTAATEALADDIKQFVKTRLALYKYPRWIEFITSLPKNDRGKIDRKLLK